MTNTSPQTARRQPEPSTWAGTLWILGISAAILAVLLFAYVDNTLIPLVALAGLIFAGVGIFPLTYLAYLAFRAPAQRDRLKDDFRLLGLAGTSELDDLVEKLYNTAYSTTHFAVFISLIVVFCVLIGTAFLYDTGNLPLKGMPMVNTAVNTTQTTAATSTAAATATAGAPRTDDKTAAQRTLVYFAFLGAYLFAIQELVRRYNTFDLLPQVYSSIFVRLLVATGVVYVGAALLTSLDAPATAPLALAIAFLIGIFPQRGIDWLADRTKDTFDTKMSISSVRPLTEIVGISPWHQARLAQMGIDDAQNLAMADIRKLLLTTQFDTQEIVNWIDQAILYVKIGQKIVSLRENYISTFCELRTALEPANGGPARVQSILGLTDTPTLNRIVDTTNFPNYTHIQEYYLRTSLVVQQRAEEGAEVIFGTRLPLLAAEIQDIDNSDATLDEKKLVKSIDQLGKLAGDAKVDAKLWMALGVQTQLLRRQRLAALRQLESSGDQAGAGSLAALQKDAADLQDQARTAFDKAIKLAPEVAESYVRRAAFLLERSTAANSASADETSLQSIEMALQDCTQAIARDPALAIAYHYRALVYIKQGDYPQALANFNRAIQANDRLGVAYMNRGTLYNGQARFAEAAADFQTAYYCGFRKAVLFANWGKALCGLEQYDLAIEKLSQAIAMVPDMAQPYADRGYAYYQLGQLAHAKADFRRAVAKDLCLSATHVNLGLVEAAQGHHAAAIKAYDKAIAADDRTPLAIAYQLRALSQQALGSQAEAIAGLQTAMELARIEPAANSVLWTPAVARTDNGHVDGALPKHQSSGLYLGDQLAKGGGDWIGRIPHSLADALKELQLAAQAASVPARRELDEPFAALRALAASSLPDAEKANVINDIEILQQELEKGTAADDELCVRSIQRIAISLPAAGPEIQALIEVPVLAGRIGPHTQAVVDGLAVG